MGAWITLAGVGFFFVMLAEAFIGVSKAVSSEAAFFLRWPICLKAAAYALALLSPAPFSLIGTFDERQYGHTA